MVQASPRVNGFAHAAPQRLEAAPRGPGRLTQALCHGFCTSLVPNTKRSRKWANLFSASPPRATDYMPVCLSISSIVALISASLSCGSPPRGGIEFLPLIADAASPATPPAVPTRPDHPPLSPTFGA